MIKRIINKLCHESYLVVHPYLWFHKVQINGIPNIGNPSNLIIGEHVSFNGNCYIQCVWGVKIGSYVTISYGVTVLTSGLQTEDYPNLCMCSERKHITAPVYIGDGVWLCANTMVMPGVAIAPRIIVGAGSVVTKDLDREGWLYAGIPAKPIKALNK